jgi:hypothetical protein
VTERDIIIWSKVRYKSRPFTIYNTGTCAFANADATVTGTSTFFLANIFTQPVWEIGTGTNPTKFYTVSSLTDNTHLEMTAAFGEANVSTTNYIASPVIEMPKEHRDLLSKYLIYRTWRKLEETDKANEIEDEFLDSLKLLKAKMVDRSDTVYPTM